MLTPRRDVVYSAAATRKRKVAHAQRAFAPSKMRCLALLLIAAVHATEHLDPKRVHLVDHDATSNNYLFRGNMSVVHIFEAGPTCSNSWELSLPEIAGIPTLYSRQHHRTFASTP